MLIQVFLDSQLVETKTEITKAEIDICVISFSILGGA